MPQDAVNLFFLSKELDEILKGAKITKINQPEKDEIFIFLYTFSGTKKLVISANANNPRCHLTSATKENPQNPPTFCMLLRKHLNSGIVKSVEIKEGERVILLNIESKTELKDNANFTLIVEIMGRQSNIFLTQNMTILGSLRQVSLDDGGRRNLLTGAKYDFPVQDGKVSPFDFDQLFQKLDEFTFGQLPDFILNNVYGVSYQSVKEILFMSDFEKRRDLGLVKKAFKDFLERETLPNVVLGEGSQRDFFFSDYQCVSGEKKFFEKFNDSIDFYYLEKDNAQRLNEHSKNFKAVLKQAISRNEKKLSAQIGQLDDCLNLDENRIKGELLTANLYKISKNQDFVMVEDFYDDMKEMKISLNRQLSPSQNAQNYFRRYQKQKRTLTFVSKQVEETKETLLSLKSILSNLERTTDLKDLALIKEDLISLKLLKVKEQKKKSNEKKSKPLEYLVNGFKIFVGKNATQNEEVDFKIGRKEDIWLHTKDYFGCHALIKGKLDEVDESTLTIAGEIAAFYSSAQSGDKVPVDYVEVKHLKKPPNGKLGLVIYNTNYTMYVTPNKHEEFILK